MTDKKKCFIIIPIIIDLITDRRHRPRLVPDRPD